MAIKFSALGDKQNFTLPEPGRYVGTIEKTEMKKSKAGADYLNVTYKLETLEGKALPNKLFDMIMDSDKNLIQYKLKRFIIATGLYDTIQEFDEFELSDLGKLVEGKKIVIDVKIRKDEQYGDKLEADLTKDRIFYALDDEGLNLIPVGSINAADAEDIGHPVDNGDEVF